MIMVQQIQHLCFMIRPSNFRWTALTLPGPRVCWQRHGEDWRSRVDDDFKGFTCTQNR